MMGVSFAREAKLTPIYLLQNSGARMRRQHQ